MDIHKDRKSANAVIKHKKNNVGKSYKEWKCYRSGNNVGIPQSKEKNKLTKTLLFNEKLLDYIFRSVGSWRTNLRKMGIDENYIISKTKYILEEESADAGLKKWAFNFLIKVLAEAE